MGVTAFATASRRFAVGLAAAVTMAATGLIPLASASPAADRDKRVVNSAQLASQLVTRMQQRGLDTFAARHPEAPDRYVAAMVFPGVQILLMSARSDATAYMDAQLAAGEYNNVYMALQQGIPASKVFFQDMGADGLQGLNGSVPDVMYERGTQQTLLDGNWRAARMSEAAYLKLVKETDERYCGYLTVLLKALTPAESR